MDARMLPRKVRNVTLYIFLSGLVTLAQTLITHLLIIFNGRRLTSIPEDHPYIPRKAGDSRAPCPALNTLANHGYLPRNGRKIRAEDLIMALREGYNLTYPLAVFLTYGGYALLHQFGTISLDDLSRHNCIEHNASLVHPDTPEDKEYASNLVNVKFMEALEADSSDGKSMTAYDVAKARVRREICAGGIDDVHAEIARGEMALVLDIFGGPDEKVPLEVLRHWLVTESFPPAWIPRHKQTLLQTIRTSAKIRSHMNAIRTSKAR